LYKNIAFMSQTSGIFIERNEQGLAQFARIDIKKYGKQLMPFFKEVGVIIEESPYDPKFVKMIKEQEKLPGVKIKASDIWK
jgi:hypothetical protein